MLDRPHKTGPYSSALSVSLSFSGKVLVVPRPDSSMEPPSEDLRNHTQSKMPTYRSVDLQRTDPAQQLSERAEVHGTSNHQLRLSSQRQQGKHLRNNSTSDINPPTNPTAHDIRPSLKTSRHLSFPTDHSSQPRPVDLSPSPSAAETPSDNNSNNNKLTARRNTKPIARNHNGSSYPPLSMITRGYTQDSTSTSTTNWVAQQSTLR